VLWWRRMTGTCRRRGEKARRMALGANALPASAAARAARVIVAPAVRLALRENSAIAAARPHAVK
jgi:hypothetical protein